VVFRNLTADVTTLSAPGISGLQVVGGAAKDQVVVPEQGTIGGDFDRDNVVGDEAAARLFGGRLYLLHTDHPLRAGNDTIRGGEGADNLIGGSGDDYLGGGSGHDLLIGDNARLTYFLAALLGLDRDDLPIERIEDQGRHGDEQYGISGNRLTNITVGGDDILEGGADDDLMFGQAGSDTYRFAGGGLGEDTAIEAGNDARTGAPNDDHDVLDFSDFVGEVTLDLSRDDRSFVNTRRLDGDVNLTLTIGANTGFEDVIGSNFDDVILGNSRDNIILGGAGNDFIFGGDGDDLLFGEEGRDVIDGGRGSDVIDGGPGNDALFGGPDADLLLGRGGNDLLDGGPAIDDLDGGQGDDRFKGVKRDRVVDPDDKSVPADQNPPGTESAQLPLPHSREHLLPVSEQEFDVLSGADSIVLNTDDLVSASVGANILAAVAARTEVTLDHKRRPFTAEALSSARRSGLQDRQAGPTLVFDESLGAWISIEEAGLLRRIDNDLPGPASPLELDSASSQATMRIDWAAQAGVRQLISRNPVQRPDISV
jgi:Ca2+-binding RTX toxin-like protein